MPPPGLERDFCLARPSATSCFVCQPFAFGTPDRAIGAFGVLNSGCGSVTIPKIAFGEIPMQVLLADVEIATVNAAFEDREEAFDGIRMCLNAVIELARPFFRAVIHSIVCSKLTTDATIGAKLIGHQPAISGLGPHSSVSVACNGVSGVWGPGAGALAPSWYG